jgi:hypothetical protein
MREIHYERSKQNPDHEDDEHFDITWITPEDFIRETEKSLNSELARDEAITLLKAKFDYLRDIMSDAAVPGVQRMIERFLKTGPKQAQRFDVLLSSFRQTGGTERETKKPWKPRRG